MATTTFSKNFKISKKDSDSFVKYMNENVSPASQKDFKSEMAHATEYMDQFKKALGIK
ncbi:hypothetical protein LFYK43_16390 [Ligilactobacillus salitolerans]|uniref:Uncharacterized protein n=1 Tax=Ligilactobacillus salitolerans TaxID=1808352 RepID=A0A401IUF1_9LACO|nr:hypothetical protein [Ligilactobacillus salitolerans]GBG95180.1 hypothetical protein LFYK43_16390 [Ligilactobacillus salitolerans]